MKVLQYKVLALLFLSAAALGSTPDWSENAKLVPGTHRENIYSLSKAEFEQTVRNGLGHIHQWPVTVSGLYIPYEPLNYFLESDQKNPLQKLVFKITKKATPFKSMDSLYDWLGLNPFNEGVSRLPTPYTEDTPMGASVLETQWGKALTFSCATCHTNQLFGKTVIGLTNKRVRANAFFHMAKKGLPLVSKNMFAAATSANSKEVELFQRSKRSLKRVGAKEPQVLGLDTSLAQVGISLSYRNKDDYATPSKFYETFPRDNALRRHVADSKPAVWWSLKYKTRWLSDGSIVSGNPIFTNFLWNEIGRGTDLHELETWLKNNQKTVKELTAAVFASKPPQWLDFFPPESIDLTSAKRGQVVFNNTCMRCHGRYDKGWEQANHGEQSLRESIKTVKVYYHPQTKVVDVGTDPGRYQGMKYFAKELNELAISKWMQTTVEPQQGYVPPPLEGIWARYPYFHNNSVPNLCALMTPPKKRPKVFYQGPANDITTEYDWDCLGYPVGKNIPASWKKESDAKFDVRRKGLSNRGHYSMFLNKDGSEKLSELDKRDLIEFLKTL